MDVVNNRTMITSIEVAFNGSIIRTDISTSIKSNHRSIVDNSLAIHSNLCVCYQEVLIVSIKRTPLGNRHKD